MRSGTDRECGDVRSTVVVEIRAVDHVVFEPLNVRLRVAQYLALKSDRFTLVDCLIAGTSLDDWRMRQTRYNYRDNVMPTMSVHLQIKITATEGSEVYYPRRQSRSAWVKCSSWSVCLTVCPEHNSNTKDPKVFKLGIGNDLGIA